MFIALLLSLCLVIPGFCKGSLGDKDAFSVYMGKTRTEVRRIAPKFDEFEDNMYMVDYIEDGDDFIGLGVFFDEYNLVQSVMVLVTDGLLKKVISDLPSDPNVEIATYYGTMMLGFDSNGYIRSEFDDDKYIFYIKGGITTVTTDLGDHLYATMTAQK